MWTWLPLDAEGNGPCGKLHCEDEVARVYTLNGWVLLLSCVSHAVDDDPLGLTHSK